MYRNPVKKPTPTWARTALGMFLLGLERINVCLLCGEIETLTLGFPLPDET